MSGGSTTLFWTDVWCGGVSFSVRFTRLYDLSVFTGESIFYLSQLGWGKREGCGGGGCLRGRRSWWGNLFYCFRI